MCVCVCVWVGVCVYTYTYIHTYERMCSYLINITHVRQACVLAQNQKLAQFTHTRFIHALQLASNYGRGTRVHSLHTLTVHTYMHCSHYIYLPSIHSKLSSEAALWDLKLARMHSLHTLTDHTCIHCAHYIYLLFIHPKLSSEAAPMGPETCTHAQPTYTH